MARPKGSKSKNSSPLKGKQKQFCIHGHDTFVCGRDKHSTCRDCKNIRAIEYAKAHQEMRLAIGKRNYLKHREERLAYHQIWDKKHRKELTTAHVKYVKKRSKVDPEFKLKVLLRQRLSMAIKNNQKKGSAVRDLGCSVEFFKEYIEKKFYSGMIWNNYGIFWQIDHIIPLVLFDLNDKEQFLKAVHYTNLQPLTIEDHKKKTATEQKYKHKIIKEN